MTIVTSADNAITVVSNPRLNFFLKNRLLKMNTGIPTAKKIKYSIIFRFDNVPSGICSLHEIQVFSESFLNPPGCYERNDHEDHTCNPASGDVAS